MRDPGPVRANNPLLIYGATGFTGQLVTRTALENGLRPVLAGRNETKLRNLTSGNGLTYRVADLADPRVLDEAMDGVKVVLNAAGPFTTTSGPLIATCLRKGVHYLDVTGEVESMHQATLRHGEARRRGIMLMPGVGFDVVPSDCLAVHVARRVDRPKSLFIGISGLELFSRGSARTIIEGLDRGPCVRRRGKIEHVAPASLQRGFDFGLGMKDSLVVSWADVASAYFSTGIPNITVYFEGTLPVRLHNQLLRAFGWAIPLTPWQALLDAGVDLWPEGPNEAQRLGKRATVVVEVEDERGHTFRSRLRTPEAYSLTAMTSVAIAARVLAGDVEAGFQTAGRLYGPDFILSFPGVEREDA